ncbi:DUF3221 domain-containing protein [Chloroflexota bacterium]
MDVLCGESRGKTDRSVIIIKISKSLFCYFVSAAILLILVTFVAVGCTSAPEALETEPDFTGFITEIYPLQKKGMLGQFLVEAPAKNIIDKYMVTIKDNTWIFKQNGDERPQVAFEALEIGQQVQIWFSGAIMESFPMQGTAQQVVIIKSPEISHRQIAEYWAPVWWQDTDDGNFRADYITNIDFDGDWDPLNNWNNLPKFKLNAYIYYWIVETTTHWFVGYADFHPRDWSDDITAPWDQHENDLEGCLLVILKDGGSYGQFVLMITRAHENFYSYKDYDSPLSNMISEGHEDIDGDVEFEGHNPHIYVKAEGHAVYGDLRWESDDFPSEDGVVYRYTGQAEEPQHGNDRNVGYNLAYIGDLWDKRNDSDIFYEFGVFRGDDYGENKAHAPWRWDDNDDGEIDAYQFFLAPAYLVDYYHDGLGKFSHDYIFQFQY